MSALGKDREPTRPTFDLVGAIVIVMLLAGMALASILVYQFLDVYFTLGSIPVVTDADGTRYVWTAGASLAILVCATIIATLRKTRGFAILGGTLLLVGLSLAFVFQVPQGRFIPAQGNPAPDNTGYTPCYSGSDCEGGG